MSHWLGFKENDIYYASDYFDQLYEWAQKMIREGKAYVDDLTADEIRQHRGTLTEGGKESPYRNRSVEENLDLFERMKSGEFPDGSRTLRAKIDMASKNLNMRDPVMYRILNARTSPDGQASGASIRCTTTPTASPIPSKASPTPSALWNSKTTARSTTGTSNNSASITRSRLNSIAST